MKDTLRNNIDEICMIAARYVKAADIYMNTIDNATIKMLMESGYYLLI